MSFAAETKPSDDLILVTTNDVEDSQDLKTTYKDWQAVRIIRDNFFDGWRIAGPQHHSATATNSAIFIGHGAPFRTKKRTPT